MLEPVITHILLIGNCNHISEAVIPALYDIIDPDLAFYCKEVELCQTVVGLRTKKIYFIYCCHGFLLHHILAGAVEYIKPKWARIMFWWWNAEFIWEQGLAVWNYILILSWGRVVVWVWNDFNCLISASPDQFYHLSLSLSLCRSWCWVVLCEGWCGKSLCSFLHPACAQWHQ